MKYTGVQCPVCFEVFDDSSDVVVCPECGTPHHRECYEKNGGCVNAAKHGGGFIWVSPIAPKEEEPAEKPKAPEPSPVPSFITRDSMPKNGVIGEMKTDQMGNQHPEYREIRGNEKIGEFTVDDYAKVVDKNVPKFMPRFMMFDKTGRKVSWNWAAFLFGPFYLAYRKMYSAAILSFVLIFFIPLVFINEVTAFYKQSYDEYTKILTSDAYQSQEEMNEAIEEAQANLPTPPYALTAASYIETAVSILCALYANYLYKKHCEKVLKKAQGMPEEKRQKYIARHGGRSLLGIILVMLVLYVIMIAVGAVYSLIGSDLGTLLKKLINK